MSDAVGALRPGRAGRRRGTSAWRDRRFAWLLVLPAVVLILAVSLYPLAYSLWVAFVNYDFQVPGHDWVGLANFRGVLEDPVARQALVNTALLSTVAVALELVL